MSWAWAICTTLMPASWLTKSPTRMPRLKLLVSVYQAVVVRPSGPAVS